MNDVLSFGLPTHYNADSGYTIAALIHWEVCRLVSMLGVTR